MADSGGEPKKASPSGKADPIGRNAVLGKPVFHDTDGIVVRREEVSNLLRSVVLAIFGRGRV